MFRALLFREVRLLVASSWMPATLMFVSYGGFAAVLLLAGDALGPGLIPNGVDLFTIFCAVSLGAGPLFLFMTAPTTMVEKSLGIAENLLAYLRSPRWLILGKALFLGGVAYSFFLFWSAVGWVLGLFASARFVGSGLFARDVVLALLFYPLVLFFFTLVQVFFIYLFPQLAQLVNVLLFAATFGIFSHITEIAGSLTKANVLAVGAAVALLGCLNGLLVAFVRGLPCEPVVRSR